jgi:hypothetical protein
MAHSDDGFPKACTRANEQEEEDQKEPERRQEQEGIRSAIKLQ